MNKIQYFDIETSINDKRIIKGIELENKIKKKITFYDNLKKDLVLSKSNKKKLNLVISKSGSTLETISNANILIKKNDESIFITENKNSYLMKLAKKLKAEVVYHNDYIGGRYSVLSEVGMLPAELMGLKQNKFKRFNDLIKNKRFVNSLILNVSNTINLIKQKINILFNILFEKNKKI